MSTESASLWVSVVLAFLVVAGLWYYSTQLEPSRPERPAVSDEQQAHPTEQPDRLGPMHPVPEMIERQRPDVRPLPSLDDSDEYLTLELADLFGPDLQAMLADERIIERMVASIDNLPRQHVAERMRPVSGMPAPFMADAAEDPNEYVLNTEGYRRYDPLVRLVGNADMDAIANLYRRYYPLFQKAYVDLGYPDGYFNDRLVDVIDHLRQTPSVDEPIRLVRTHVLYQFADPELESLSSGQKMLLRMGPDNASTIKAELMELRTLIATPQTGVEP